MKLEFDSTEKPETLRAVAAFALMLAGDIDVPSVKDAEIPYGAQGSTASAHGVGAQAQNLPREMITPPMGNVVPFPTAPPVPSVVVPTVLSSNVPPFPGSAQPSPFTVAAVPGVPLSSGTLAQPSLNPPPTPSAPGTASSATILGFSTAAPVPAPLAHAIGTNGAPTPPLYALTVQAQQPSAAATIPSAPIGALPPFPPAFAPDAAAPTQPVSATNVGAAAPAASVEYDKAGLPWDARIHNKGRTKKKDGTWKLQKGLDPIVAQTVVAELAARKLAPGAIAAPPTFPDLPPQSASVPPHQSSPMPAMQPQAPIAPQWPASPLPPTGGPLTPEQEARAAYSNRAVGTMPELAAAYTGAQVSLPPAIPYRYPVAGQAQGALPVPPFPMESAITTVPPQGFAAPVPPAPQPGTVGGVSPALQPQLGPSSPYKALIDKLTAATQNKTLNPALVAPTVQRFGVPNMGMLGDPTYAGLLPAISQEFDRLIAGGAPSGS